MALMAHAGKIQQLTVRELTNLIEDERPDVADTVRKSQAQEGEEGGGEELGGMEEIDLTYLE
ncbi:hypothetical protein PRK78_005778 [Emydomyces testavorans]|uniref:Uncharacterized protein n=1 Tax=Emydomyces testavorans TaxID=2070801 RepID=A0AAF0DLC8_9EURO|nr:hypothetical protein PRK78_005778 [Emydomyces testavorans]